MTGKPVTGKPVTGKPVTGKLWVVLPGGIDDPAAPSGGNRYDRAVLTRLRSGPAGPRFDIQELLVGGAWPTPGAADRAAFARALAGIPGGADVLLDGLVACGVPELLRPHAARLRLIVLVHLPLSDETGLDPAEAGRLRALEREALHLATTVIATSKQAARHVETLHDLPQVHVAEPGVDLGPFAEPAGPGARPPAEEAGPGAAEEAGPGAAEEAGPGPAEEAGPGAGPGVGPASPRERRDGGRLLCVASVTPRKGQDVLVGVLEGALADLAWTCTFVGAVRVPVPFSHPGIRFAGALVGRALDTAYTNSDLFVLASRAETYGMVVTEALARGLPVVTTAVGGLPEALGSAPGGELPGALVPPDDPAALAAVLRAWLTDPELRARWRAAARERRRTLPSWDDTAARIAAFVNGGRSARVPAPGDY